MYSESVWREEKEKMGLRGNVEGRSKVHLCGDGMNDKNGRM